MAKLTAIIAFVFLFLTGQARASDCSLLFKQMLLNQREEVPVRMFVDEQADATGRIYVTSLIPLLLELDRLERDPDRHPEAIQKWLKDRNDVLIAHAPARPDGNRPTRLTKQEIEDRLTGYFVLEFPVPMDGMSPFSTWESREKAVETNLPSAMKLNEATLWNRGVPMDVGKLTVTGTQVVREGHFIKLPSGAISSLGHQSEIIGEGIWMSDMPITQLQFATRMGDNAPIPFTPGKPKAQDKPFLRVRGNLVGYNRAATNFTSSQAEAFCFMETQEQRTAWEQKWGEKYRKFLAEGGKPRDFPHKYWSYRLPTAGEWEYAARGGTSEPWWNTRPEPNARERGRVDDRKPNPWGFFAMDSARVEMAFDRNSTFPEYVAIGRPTGNAFEQWPVPNYAAAPGMGFRVVREAKP